jgi:hypothetical protein
VYRGTFNSIYGYPVKSAKGDYHRLRVKFNPESCAQFPGIWEHDEKNILLNANKKCACLVNLMTGLTFYIHQQIYSALLQ